MSTTTPQDLVFAVRSGKLSEVVARLETGIGRQRPADLGLGLAMASFLGYRDIVRELVKRGALLNLPPGLADASPLAMAVKGGQRKTTRLLIALGAQIPPGLDVRLTEEELKEAKSIARRRAAAGKGERRITASPPGSPARRAIDIAPSAPPTPATPPRPAASPSAQPARPPAPPIAAQRPPAPPPLRSIPQPAPQPASRPASRPASQPIASLDFTAPSPIAPAPVIAPPTPEPQPQPAKQRRGIVEEIEMTACYGVDTNVLEGDLMRWNPGASDPGRPSEDKSINAPELDLDKNRGTRRR